MSELAIARLRMQMESALRRAHHAATEACYHDSQALGFRAEEQRERQTAQEFADAIALLTLGTVA